MTAAGQTYEEIAQLVAEQVGGGSVIFRSLLEGLLLKKKKKDGVLLFLNVSCLRSVFTSFL